MHCSTHKLLDYFLISKETFNIFFCKSKNPFNPWVFFNCFHRRRMLVFFLSLFKHPAHAKKKPFRKPPTNATPLHNYKRRPRRPPFLRVESVGIGVTSSIRPMPIPARAKARSAAWAPGPGVLVLLPPVARSLM